jgi:hypothetical protein
MKNQVDKVKCVMKKKKALVVLENPWSTNGKFSHECSVKPFLTGLKELEGDFDLLYATFFDLGSFSKALELYIDGSYEKYVLYVAAHGETNEIAGIKDRKLLYGGITPVAEAQNLEGVLFGSCLFGSKTAKLEELLRDTRLCWTIGYRHSVDWFSGTLLDLAILKEMLCLRKRDIEDRETILEKVRKALGLFNQDAIVGTDKEKQPVPLSELISLVIQPSGQGHKPRDASEELFAA